MTPERKRTRYVVCEKTIGELKELGEVDWSGVKLYEHVFDRSNLSEGQKVAQSNNRWKVEVGGRTHFSNDNAVDIVSGVIEKVALSKYRGDFAEKVKEEVNNVKVYCCISITENLNNGFIDTYSETFTDYTLEDKYTNEVVILNHGAIDELEEKLEKSKMYSGYTNKEDDYVFAEKAHFDYDRYTYQALQALSKKIKTLVKTKMVYCLKQGKNIVPDEYLDKGIKGLEEWQTIKRSGNKNNSMEKKLIRDCLRSKKEFVDSCLHNATRKIVMNQDWSLPNITINGMYNQCYMKRLVSELLKDKSNQDIIQLTDEEILAMTKAHWKMKLEDAIAKLDSLKLEEIKK